MLDDRENVNQEQEENQEEVQGQEQEQVEKSDRPEKNYKAELERKNREIEKLRMEMEAKREITSNKRDPNDLSTWGDHELKAIKNSNDPNTLSYKDQAEEILLERRVRGIREKERMQEKRALTDLELRTKYPDALDPQSEFSLKMEQVISEFDLHKSPAGRLAAAKIVSAELGKGRSNKSALERNNEQSRLRDVKAQMVDGDRSMSSESNKSPKKVEEIENGLRNGKQGAVSDALKLKGIDHKNFFGKR